MNRIKNIMEFISVSGATAAFFGIGYIERGGNIKNALAVIVCGLIVAAIGVYIASYIEQNMDRKSEK